MGRNVTAVVVAILVVGLTSTVAGQEPVEGGDFGDVLGDVRTFTGRLHEGLLLVPGLDIQLVFPLHHWEHPRVPEIQVNKTTNSGRCQVCIYGADNAAFFAPGGTASPAITQVCKQMSSAQTMINVRLPRSANPDEHLDAWWTMACEDTAFIIYRAKRIG